VLVPVRTSRWTLGGPPARGAGEGGRGEEGETGAMFTVCARE